MGRDVAWVASRSRSAPPSICTILSSKFERILPFHRDPCAAPHGKDHKRGVLHLRLFSAPSFCCSTGSKEVKIRLLPTQRKRYQVNLFAIGDVPCHERISRSPLQYSYSYMFSGSSRTLPPGKPSPRRSNVTLAGMSLAASRHFLQFQSRQRRREKERMTKSMKRLLTPRPLWLAPGWALQALVTLLSK